MNQMLVFIYIRFFYFFYLFFIETIASQFVFEENVRLEKKKNNHHVQCHGQLSFPVKRKIY